MTTSTTPKNTPAPKSPDNLTPNGFAAFAKLVADQFQIIALSNPFAVDCSTVIVDQDAETELTTASGDMLWRIYLAAFPAGTDPIFKKRTEHDCSCCKSFIRHVGDVVAVENGVLVTIWDAAARSAPYPYDVVAATLASRVRSAHIANLYRVNEKEGSFGAQTTRSQTLDVNPYPFAGTCPRCKHVTDGQSEGKVACKWGGCNGVVTLSQILDAAERIKVLTWSHFYTGEIPRPLRSKTPDKVRGDYRTTVQVFERGLKELSADAIDTTLSMIDANALYRGEEHKAAVVAFQAAKRTYGAMEPAAQAIYAWTNAHGPAARFRNTVIGTLVQDLSEPGADIEKAVAAFESKVAPQNYKRTTAVITPAMVKKAMEKITELGLEPALERRFARIDDISVNDALWVDSSVKPLMKGGIADALLAHAEKARADDFDADEKRADSVTLDYFMQVVLPHANSMELLFRGEHLGNLMSLTAPVHEPSAKPITCPTCSGRGSYAGYPADTGSTCQKCGGSGRLGTRQERWWGLFRWGNDFAWSYAGNITDSIKERVKKAGGKVDGAALRISLSWFNYDDLDLHVYEPARRMMVRATDANHIFFRNKRGQTGGVLDVDMNAGTGTTRQAVENVAWSVTPPDGAYKVVVNNYSLRERDNIGFVIEVESGGKLSHFNFNHLVKGQEDVHVVTLHVKEGRVERFEVGDTRITTKAVSQEKWGLTTERYVKVNAVCLSPNYWSSATPEVEPQPNGTPAEVMADLVEDLKARLDGRDGQGNKHTFFVLDGARNDEPTRGIYNEFLHPRLVEHRKVFEIIGEKTKCQPTEGQLSGLGFSSTKKDSVLIRVTSEASGKGKKTRLYNVQIGGSAPTGAT